MASKNLDVGNNRNTSLTPPGKDINVETETSQPQGTKRKRQQTFDEYKFAFTSKDQIILESLLIRAFTQRLSTPKPLFFKATAFKEERHTSENIALGLETTMKDADINKFGAIITDNAPNMKAAWKILNQKYPKKIFLGCWAHGDETFLSTAYLEYQQLKAHVRNNTDLPENIREEVEKFGTNRWQNFLYNPVVIVAYKLDPRYCGSRLNARIFDPIIEKEILSLVGEEYKDIVLTELAEYVGKTGSFAHSNLWGDQLKAHVQNNTNLPENIHEEVEKFGTNRWQNFLYNPVVIVTYKLDPRYRNSWLNVRIFNPIIEKKILSLVGEEYKDIVLTEFAEYVGKIGSFAHSYLWEM
ncbi:hypothetical protein RhiirB3_393462 [Rhizophagus irregularis]|nr:hypothetical protein RhiirB3_393462 [Rhizophagus irregularis]